MFRKVASPALTGACLRSWPPCAPVDRAGATHSALEAVSCLTTARSGHPSHLCSQCTSLCASQRFYFRASSVCREDATQHASAAPSGQSNESALDVAMRVNKLKKTHQTGGAGTIKTEVEQEAWQALNSLTEDQINNAEGKAVSLLLNSWAYFAKFWANGKDGPV